MTIRSVIGWRCHAQLGVDARHDDVEAGEQVVVEVERAVLEDVDLHAGEDAERRQLLVERGDLDELALEPLAVEAVGDGEPGEWSVSTMYSWPRALAVVAISSISAPPSLHVEWRWQSPRRASR